MGAEASKRENLVKIQPVEGSGEVAMTPPHVFSIFELRMSSFDAFWELIFSPDQSVRWVQKLPNAKIW